MGMAGPQDEAFQLWTSEWGSLYEQGSTSAKLIRCHILQI